MKRCRVCGLEKPISEFYKDSSRADGFEYQCKICHKKQVKERALRAADIANQLRSSCKKCGENRTYLLDFHHVDSSTKKFNVSKHNRVSDKLTDELKKCVCLCANCHREFHYLYGTNPEDPTGALHEYLET